MRQSYRCKKRNSHHHGHSRRCQQNLWGHGKEAKDYRRTGTDFVNGRRNMSAEGNGILRQQTGVLQFKHKCCHGKWNRCDHRHRQGTCIYLCERRWHEGAHDSNCQRKIILQEAEPNYGLYDRQSADYNQRDNQRKILMMHIYNDIIERNDGNRRIILYGEEWLCWE